MRIRAVFSRWWNLLPANNIQESASRETATFMSNANINERGETNCMKRHGPLWHEPHRWRYLRPICLLLLFIHPARRAGILLIMRRLFPWTARGAGRRKLKRNSRDNDAQPSFMPLAALWKRCEKTTMVSRGHYNTVAYGRDRPGSFRWLIAALAKRWTSSRHRHILLFMKTERPGNKYSIQTYREQIAYQERHVKKRHCRDRKPIDWHRT